MNREIKFRIWYIEQKKWITDENLDLFVAPHNTNLNEFFAGNDDWFVFQQFTGLRDSNNKDIYEGDIIQTQVLIGGDELDKFTVVFKDGAFRRDWDFCRSEGLLFNEINQGYAEEVIGNILENPELLK